MRKTTQIRLLRLVLLTIFVTFFRSWVASAEDVPAGTAFRIGVQSLEQLSDEDFAVLKVHKLDGRYGSYVAPNEWEPNLLLPLIDGAPDGSLVSVGTQRCFIIAAKVKKISKVHCFDIGHGVLVFNLLNAKLIEIAKSRRDFLFLAAKAPLKVWQKRLASLDFGDEKLQDLFDFWNLHYRVNPLNHLFTNPPTDLLFTGMNYLYNNKLFLHLQKMIRAHDVTFDWIDLTNMNDVSALVATMKQNGETLSILDVSNVPEWTTFENVAPTIYEFTKISIPQTEVVQTTEGDPWWTYWAFNMTAENQQKLKSYNGTPVFDLKPGSDFNRYFSAKPSADLRCRGNECEVFKRELKDLARDWDHYLGSDSK